MRCWIGWHKWSCYSHRLGQPWVFYMHCLRCGKQLENRYQLPPQLRDQIAERDKQMALLALAHFSDLDDDGKRPIWPHENGAPE